MLRFRRPQRLQYSTIAEKRYSSHCPLQRLEKDGAKILRLVQRKAEERANWLLQNSGTSAGDYGMPGRRIRELESIHRAWTVWSRAKEQLQGTLPLLEDPDPEMQSLALKEYNALVSTLSHQVCTVFPALLMPKSTTAHLSTIIELKSGIGGSESSLFLSDLVRMYLRFSNSAGWKAEVMSDTPTDGGGSKDAMIEVKGEGSYDALRWETGVHRVQRIPATEASGRVHTSTVTTLVLPLSESEGEQEALFSLNDIKVEVMRSRGAGGQHVNKTESAVRLTHRPTGITVSIQDQRSQHQNKRQAFRVLTARLMDLRITKEMTERRTMRQRLVKGADRSEKIRTYNYPQDRVTDHRIGLTLKNLSSVMESDGLREFIDALRKDYEQTVMEDLLENA